MQHILCAVDFSDCSRQAARQATSLARWYGARLTMVHVFQNLPVADLPPVPLDAAGRDRLTRSLSAVVGDPPPGVARDLRIEDSDSVSRTIGALAKELQADLVVLGSHGRSALKRAFLGSVAEQVLHAVHCPTLIVPPGAQVSAPAEPPKFRKILCAVDFSDSSLGALTYAFRLAEENDSMLTLLHVVELAPDLHELLVGASLDIETVRRAAEEHSRRRLETLVPDAVRAYCTVAIDVRLGAAHHEIVDAGAADRSDVIVMGMSGRRSLGALLLGSTTSRVARSAGRPVMVVRA